MIATQDKIDLSTHQLTILTTFSIVNRMNIDYLTLSCWRDEAKKFLPARVQNILQVDDLSIGMELYAGVRLNLLLSAHPQNARVLFTPYKLRRGVDKPHTFLSLLRSRLKGARLVGIQQPPWERILNLIFETDEAQFTLVAELMGRYSNLILLDENNVVLEAIKRIHTHQNRHRVILPAHPYQNPPTPENRFAPDAVNWKAVLSHQAEEKTLARLLSKHLLATSPTLAREIEARLGENAPTSETLEPIIATFFDSSAENQWHPSLGYDNESHLIAFAPYELKQCARSESIESINEAILQYNEHGQTADAYAQVRKQTAAHLQKIHSRIDNCIRKMRAQKIDPSKITRLRENGELLLSYQFMVQRGMSEIEMPDYEGNPRMIRFNPRLSPSDNAQVFFKRYNKAQRAIKGLPRRMRREEAHLIYLEQLAVDLSLASSRPQIDAVYNALVEEGWLKEKKRSKSPDGGPLRFEVDDWIILVGRSAKQNEQVSFKMSSPEDHWLHVHDKPGAHVIIKSNGREVSEDVLQFAAQCAAHYSSAREQNSGVQVNITRRKHIRHIPGGHPGLVTYRNSESLWIEDASRKPRSEE
ncbi:MAG: NFACT family protein [Anaerolineaceae bacterium]|nr:NFACT family protein [Anaerolineaceae bacterium]